MRSIAITMTWLLLLASLPAMAAEKGAEKGVESSSYRSAHQTYADPNDMSTVPRLVRKVLVRATAKAARGDHAEAVVLLSEHLRDYPDQDHYLLHYHRGRSYEALSQYEEAREDYAQAVAMESRLAAGWFGLGHVNYNLGAYEESGVAFLKSFQTDERPGPDTLYFAAAGYMLAGSYEKAAPLLDELCRGLWGEPRHEWYAQLASCAIHLERPELAEALLAEYLADRPDREEAWYLMYQFRVGLKDYHEAAVALTIVSYLRTLSENELQILGDLYSVIGVPALASERYAATLDAGADAADYERLVSALVAAHDLDAALAALRDGLERESSSRLWSLLGDVHYLRKDYAAAAAAFEQVVELEPDAGRPLLMIGYCHIELGNRGQAIQHLVAAAKHESQADLAERLLVRARKMDRV
jgi:tetratricopeptide (TPR) repeat protein